IPPDAFRHAVQMIDADGQVYAGAAGTYRLLRYAPHRQFWWWLYSYVPGFAPLSEQAYRFLSRRRGLLNRLSKFFWGPALERERYDLVIWVFLRGLGMIYLAAFASLGVQILGLIGSSGVLPLSSYLQAAHDYYGDSALRMLPTLFWLNASDS